MGAFLKGTGTGGPFGPAGRKTFVLVHGSWHGGWCWSRVAEPLRAKEITLDAWITDLVNVLEPRRDGYDPQDLTDILLGV